MVMKVNCEVKQNLVVNLTYDDETTKTLKLGEGDFVHIRYNKNGMNRYINGIINTIHADPYNGQLSRKDWYIIIANEDHSPGAIPSVKINIVNILDVVLIHSASSCNPINTPNSPMRVTDIRVKENFLQISQNWGESWRTVGINEDGTLSDDFVGSDKTIEEAITNMIGSDQYSSSDEFVQGVIDIINDEVRKRLRGRCICAHEDRTSSCISEEG